MLSSMVLAALAVVAHEPCTRPKCAEAQRTPFPIASACAHGVARLSSAAEQLAHAVDLKQAARIESAQLGAAIAAFDAVRVHFPERGADGAEAAFRAGELWRAAGRPGLAAREFETAAELGGRGDFRSRALLELGHLARRHGLTALAIARFEALALDRLARSRWRDEGALAVGRMHALERRYDDARRWLQRVAEGGDDELVRVRAYDAWALTYVEVDDIEAAAGVLALARNALNGVALEETELGRRVASALERMTCITRMEQAVVARRAAQRRLAER